ncbi:SusC/RagA family TonB-linked outer membrane protein [Mucilaginibacter sp. UR6-11]|uniref:SusC/RagA family TonB-linked outer membrane protein n=1 Tax=Mucilaginibacter sp. UR6-11 TaxID=1435644 RepID=UPI001E42034C|nr:SusC/RagA family TonB-linked outer membrane protein [Mucilaginibacter sp. UR6-11]MCC8426877.1 SusC/RagA family TonB-linked outer membrane protein [Mucilaginibacter sp. UR6-11]
MKLTTLLLMAMILQVSATTLAQKVTLNEKNAPLGQIFNKISSQTGYDFLFTTTLLKGTKPVSVNVTNANLNDVLKQIFDGQPLEFSIEDKAVVVSPKQKSFLERVSSLFVVPIDVKGRVVDMVTGGPLAGATVIVKGQTKGTRTGADGAFFLPNVDENAILVISFIGYKAKEVKSSKDVGTIQMEVAVGNLQEVGVTVNTGYQRIRPEQSTGAVAQIGTKEYESRISTNFLDGLVNRLPGLMINNDVPFNSITPGSTTSTARSLFNIRGISTMSANQNPLIVIDGYPTELTIDMIDPNEIKSVTILKDAAAATVYGVRASNGVIIIERKQAVAGKARFTFRATTSITPKENYTRYRTADDESSIVLNYQKTLYSKSIDATTWSQMSTIGSNSRSPFSPVYYIIAESAAKVITPEQAANSYAALQNYNNSEDYSRLFLQPAVTQTYNLNASGGSDNALYYITGNYTGNRLSKINNDNNRISLSARSTIKLSTRLSLELTTDYQEQRFNSAPVPDISSLMPFEHLQDVNGNPVAVTSGSAVNPFYNNALMSKGLENSLYYPLIDVNEQNDKTRTANNRITANFNYNLGRGFGLSFGGIYETSKSDIRHYASANSSQAKQYIDDYIQLNTDGTLKYNIPKGGYLRQETENTSTYTTRAQLNYNKRIGQHSFNGILGTEVRDVINKSNLASYFGYSDETLLQQPVDYAGIVNGTTRSSFALSSPFVSSYSNLFDQQYIEDRYLSGYGNMVYSFKDTYSLTGSIRVDQSNLFGTNPKYKYKPLWSVGAAWNIDKESFMQDVNWVNQLKLRAAYGFNGNVAKLSLPQAIAQYVLNTNTLPSSTALRPLSYANSSLRWEQTKNSNIGLDYHIFRNLTGSVDYYIKNSTDLLGNSLIDPTIGLSPSIINKATIRNNGIEFSLHADWIAKKNLNWNTGLVLARNTSKVLDVYQSGAYNPQTLNVLGYVKGYPVGAMFAYRDAGLNSAGYPQVQNQNGKIFQTDNNALGSPQTAILSSDTSGVTRYMGSSIPTISAGLSNRVDIGNFYIFCMINYYGGFKVRIPRPNPSAFRPLEGSGNYWKAPGDEKTTDVMSLAAFSTSANSNNAYAYSDKYVVNGDYITLGDLTLSYSLNSKVIKKLGFTHFEIKCQGSNLWTHGFNKSNYSASMGSFQKSYITPTYTLGIFTNF